MRSRTDEAREIALRLIGEKPRIQQRELVPAIQEETDLATSTITRMLQRMERDGELKGVLDGRRKAYALPGAPVRVRAEPAAAPAAPPPSKGSRGELVALVTALFIAAALVAFVLAPNKDDSSGSTGLAAPVASQAPPPPPAKTRSEPAPKPKAQPKPKPKPKRAAPSTGALAAAKRTRVAVLSGSPVPGIAARTGAALKREGFKVGTVGNAPGPSSTSVVLYAGGKKSAARALARSIKIAAVKPADPATQAIDPGAGLLVVVGADRRR